MIKKNQGIQTLYGIILSLFIVACGGGEDTNTTEPISSNEATETTASPTSTAATPSTTSPNAIAVLNEAGEEVTSFDLNSAETIIKYDKSRKTLSGISKRADKTKYHNEKGDIVAEVKFKEGSFKLKNTNGDLLWKVKIKPEKIKISDNEENENAFEIKQNENGKYKVKLLEETLGEAKLKDGKVSLSGAKKMEIVSATNSPAFAVLTIRDIPEDLRLIIAAELMKQ